MIGRSIVVCFLLVTAGMANAAEPKHSGLYLGGSFGTSVFDDDGVFAGLNFDDQDQSLQGTVGYKFFPYLAVEARYTNYGTFNLATFNNPAAVGFDVTAFSVHAVGIVPFGSSGWELFGQLGLGSLSFDISGTDDSQRTVAGGLGIRYYATESLSIGVQTDVHVWEDTSLGGDPILGVGGTQLSMQLAF